MPNKALCAWLSSNRGHYYLTERDGKAFKYIDNGGVERYASYHGAKDESKMLDDLKVYVNWRLEQVEDYPEITFNTDFTHFKIGMLW